MNKLHHVFTVYCLFFLTTTALFGMKKNNNSNQSLIVHNIEKEYDEICKTFINPRNWTKNSDNNWQLVSSPTIIDRLKSLLFHHPSGETVLLNKHFIDYKKQCGLVHHIVFMSTYMSHYDLIPSEMESFFNIIFEYNADVNLQDAFGNTPLHYAFQDVLLCDPNTKTKIVFPKKKFNFFVVLRLLRYGANPHIPNNNQECPFHYINALSLDKHPYYDRKLEGYETMRIYVLKAWCNTISKANVS